MRGRLEPWCLCWKARFKYRVTLRRAMFGRNPSPPEKPPKSVAEGDVASFALLLSKEPDLTIEERDGDYIIRPRTN